jgi:endonuclease/exonuclease/phosphatase family metal-dependent hydrolase
MQIKEATLAQLTPVRTMTFNIAGGNKIGDGINRWSNRATLNTKTIVEIAPDIIGFQECHAENLVVYQSSLKEYTFYLGHKIDARNYNPVFWKTSHFDFIEGGQFWLSSTPDVATSHVARHAAFPRAATWVKLHLKDERLTLLLMNTHWDNIGEEARRQSAHLISKKVRQLRKEGQLPAIVFGDFNCSRWRPQDDSRSGTPSTDEPYRFLVSQGFIDCFTAAGNRDSSSSNTFHGFMGENYEPWRHHMLWRADWILLFDLEGRIRVESCFIVREGEPPLFPSDHYPVVADFVVQDANTQLRR